MKAVWDFFQNQILGMKWLNALIGDGLSALGLECVDHCHGCGNLCPAGAITYVGEDTGLVPPMAKKV